MINVNIFIIILVSLILNSTEVIVFYFRLHILSATPFTNTQQKKNKQIANLAKYIKYSILICNGTARLFSELITETITF